MLNVMVVCGRVHGMWKGNGKMKRSKSDGIVLDVMGVRSRVVGR